MPLTTARNRVIGASEANRRAVNAILVKMEEGADMGAAEKQIQSLLRQRHRIQPGQDDDFWLRNLSEVVEAQQASSRALTVLLAAIASVSLVVGGIGIMNIMLASVMERTREIGIRRATGATKTAIVLQFLTEATIISITGGMIGIFTGVALSLAIEQFAGILTIITAFSVVLSFVISISVGIVFGILPARRAAEQDPVVCLRYE